ncbi:MAG: hypothetical protein QXK93_07290 [Candidatus Bathyarchaeia archaeon]|nr:hypothetical protein [Candidatus Bathyarchaeota archaeon]
MAEKFSEVWKISGVVYREVCFQSIFSLRLGAALPQMDSQKINRIAKQAEINMLISKILITIFVVVLAVLPLGFWSYFIMELKLAEELAVVSCVSVFLASLFFLLVMLGLQATTSLISTKAFEILGNLPISRKDISRIALVSFLRIFDIPLTAVLVIFPLVFSIVVRSFFGGLVALFAAVLTEIFALALTIGLAKFFYSRIVGGGGGSKYKTIIRFIYMLVWILPSFGIYLIMNFATRILQIFAYSLTQLSFVHILVFAFVYPFSLGFAVAFATFPQKISLAFVTVLIVSIILYVALGYFGLNYIKSTIKRVGSSGLIAVSKAFVKDLIIQPKSAILGIIIKDIRIASRSPSYASILMLPALQTLIVVVSILGITGINLVTVLGFLTGVSLLSLMVTPTLFSAETLASAYTRSLPLKRSTVIAAKTFLSTVTYLCCVVVLTIIALYLRKEPIILTAFGLGQTISVSAGCLAELLLLVKKFWDVKLAPGGIYTNLGAFIIVLIPGIILCLTPITICFIVGFTNILHTLAIFVASAVVEFVTVAFLIRILIKD